VAHQEKLVEEIVLELKHNFVVPVKSSCRASAYTVMTPGRSAFSKMGQIELPFMTCST
jgi:hypothetical protein